MLIANYVAVTGNSEAAYELLHVDAGREGKETVGSLSLAYQQDGTQSYLFNTEINDLAYLY